MKDEDGEEPSAFVLGLKQSKDETMNQSQQENPPELGVRHRVRDDLKAYVDGELSVLRRWLVARHVRQCAACRAEARGLEQLSRTLSRLDNAAAPGALPRPELRARILACLPPPTPQQSAQATVMARLPVWSARGPRLAFGSLTALALLMAGVFALNRRHPAGQLIGHDAAIAIASSDTAPSRAGIPSTSDSLKVVAIFTSPKESFPVNGAAASTHAAASTASQANTDGTAANVSQPAGDSADSAVRSSFNNTSQNDTSQQAASTSPREDAYTDPTSREAERLMMERITQHLHDKHQQMAAVKKPLSTAPEQRSPSDGIGTQGNGTSAAPAQIALAVLDVSEAHRQLREWAQTAGATLSVVKPGKSASVASADVKPTGKLLELRVPAQSAESLKVNLLQLGTPVAPSVSGAPRLGGQPLRPSEMTAGTPPLPPPPSMLLDRALHSGASPFVTVRVQLLPGEAATQDRR